MVAGVVVAVVAVVLASGRSEMTILVTDLPEVGRTASQQEPSLGSPRSVTLGTELVH